MIYEAASKSGFAQLKKILNWIWKKCKYRKVTSSRLSWLAAHSRIFKLFMTGKFDAYVLWPLAKRVQSWIVDRSTARDFTVAILYLTILHELNGTSIDNFVVWSFPVFLSSVFATYAWHEFWTCSHNHFINFHHCNKGWNLAFGQFQKLFEKTAISTTKNQNLLTLKKETNIINLTMYNYGNTGCRVLKREIKNFA